MLGHPIKSSISLFSFYSEAGNVLVPTSSDSVQQTWKQVLFIHAPRSFPVKRAIQQAQLLYQNESVQIKKHQK